MKIAILGRSGHLLRTAKELFRQGHEITLIGTASSEDYYDAHEGDFKDFANNIGAEFFIDGNLNTKERIHQLKTSGARVAISVNWPNLLGKEVCEGFEYGILNAHAGDLPRYRGNACPNWAILNGEKYVGLCIHQMEPGQLDSGPVFVREHFPLTQNTYISDVYRWMDERIPSMFHNALQVLGEGTIAPQKQPENPKLALRCYPRRPEDSRIIWSEEADIVHRLVRASSRPLSGAFCYLEGDQKVIIWKASIAKQVENFLAIPGQVLFVENGDPVIACGRGAIRLEEVSMAGVDSMMAKKEIARSLRNRLV